ncbi:MAG TPA: hypothetical protein PLS71_06630 [Leptospiraceae bacterium]|nr:hypothetical protein [Leptospiraceae bacterium]HNB97896.1 hypothetical protein [Leptospiraceae bacterium]HNE11103.1 hypothetical protein [Leptospiraceae bacterium]HNH02086.1 hypothetical protein [Leptospiraceae bacterium]HNK56931.1 hypothetical protein [Leptospiraceae bacterium]
MTNYRLAHFNIDINKFEKLLRLISESDQKKITIPKLLPNEMINIIGNESVDIFPYQVGRVLASGLYWKNRPVYQSYITSSEWLIQQNVNFFNDHEKSPEYIIFHYPYSLDHRYLLNDELQTFLRIRDLYESILLKDNFLLLKKRGNKSRSANWETKLKQISKPNATIIFENEIIQKSSIGNNICVGSLDIRKSLYGILKKILYKEEPIFITYYLDDSSRTFRYIPDLGKSGILLYPFLESSGDLYDFFSKKERVFPVVTGISIDFRTNESFYEENYKIEIKCTN